MKQNCGKPKEVSKTAMNAGLYHQFNDHVHCSGEWCKYVHIPAELWNDVNENNNNKLCNKVFDELIWNEAKAIHDLFVTDKNLDMLNHEFDSQKNEALNMAFTKVAPKNMFFQRHIHYTIDWLLSLHITQLVYYHAFFICYFRMKHMFYLQLKQHGRNSRISSIRTKQLVNVHPSVKECSVQNIRQSLN